MWIKKVTQKKICFDILFYFFTFVVIAVALPPIWREAYARLGDLGGWQSGTLYLTYTGSAILGATDVVKKLGARNAITLSMIIYCVYIGCFLIATLVPDFQYISAISGAAIGGIGAGFMWTAQVRTFLVYFLLREQCFIYEPQLSSFFFSLQYRDLISRKQLKNIRF